MNASSRARLARLRALMDQYQLTSVAVAEILDRGPAHVRSWMAGIHPMPAPMLRLLELELKERGAPPAPGSTIAVQS